MPYATVNPYTNELVKSFPYATDAAIDAALERAQKAFVTWSRTPISERCAILAQAAKLVMERKDELAPLLTLEMGKLAAEAQAEVAFASYSLQYFAEHAEDLLKPRRLAVEPGSGDVTVVYQPSGILLSIEPWNVPYIQAMRPFAPNVALGNVVLLKHASIVPQCAAAIVDVVNEAGFPEGVYTNLYLDHEQTARVIADPRVRGVTLTGSAAAGKLIAARAGEFMKKTVMELGGSDAFVVLPDADLDLTVACAVPARFYNGGQVCISSKRIIVTDPVYDEFRERFTASVATLHPGDPADLATTLPPMSSQSQADIVKEQIARAVSHGATATPVGDSVPARGAFVQPTILTGVTRDNPVYYEEIFGPVPMLLRARDEDEAVALANDSPFGLAGTVWSRDLGHGFEVAKRIDTGSVYVNQPAGGGPDVPMGGTKDSGYGFEFGPMGIVEFANQKVITVPNAQSGSIVLGGFNEDSAN